MNPKKTITPLQIYHYLNNANRQTEQNRIRRAQWAARYFHAYGELPPSVCVYRSYQTPQQMIGVR